MNTADVLPAISAWFTPAAALRRQRQLDKLVPMVRARWLFLGLLAAAFAARVYLAKGFYLVCYGVAIYALNLLIAFITPLADPDPDDYGGAQLLPTRDSDEFRPFVRRLPEFKLWNSMTRAFLIALLMTLFDEFDVPVCWQILVFYWFTLFVLTMRTQIKHMLRYKYVPFTVGKQRYKGKKAASVNDANF